MYLPVGLLGWINMEKPHPVRPAIIFPSIPLPIVARFVVFVALWGLMMWGLVFCRRPLDHTVWPLTSSRMSCLDCQLNSRPPCGVGAHWVAQTAPPCELHHRPPPFGSHSVGYRLRGCRSQGSAEKKKNQWDSVALRVSHGDCG